MKSKNLFSSLTIQGLLLTILMFLKGHFEWDISASNAEEIVTVLLEVVGIVMTFLGRFRHGNLTIIPKEQ
jgi:hypothetical protein